MLTNELRKTLLYNLILFDFILLETSTNKISNFFLEKIKKSKNQIVRLSLPQVVKSFKQFIKLQYFSVLNMIPFLFLPDFFNFKYIIFKMYI